ncbi:MAG: LPS assembly lipoprotein LptE [Phycisphaerales bacterium]
MGSRLLQAKDVRFEIGLWISCVPAVLCLVLAAGGCGRSTGYSNASLFPNEVESVYVEMFDNRSFRRGTEFTFSNALAKQIETQTPYKVVSSRDRADSVMGGQLVAINESILTLERDLGRALEKEVLLTAVVNWKSLKSGKLMINSQTVTAAATYSEFQGQDFTYASAVAANKLALKVVQLMENPW